MIGSSLAWVAEEQEHKRMRLLFSPSLTYGISHRLNYRQFLISVNAALRRSEMGQRTLLTQLKMYVHPFQPGRISLLIRTLA